MEKRTVLSMELRREAPRGLVEGKFEVGRCACGRSFITSKQIIGGRCERCETEQRRPIVLAARRGALSAEVEARQ